MRTRADRILSPLSLASQIVWQTEWKRHGSRRPLACPNAKCNSYSGSGGVDRFAAQGARFPAARVHTDSLRRVSWELSTR